MKAVIVLGMAIGLLAASKRQAECADGEARAVLEVIPKVEFELEGPMRERVEANVRHWLLHAPASNPAMLQIFRDRDRTPRRDLVPWAGEFAGKYLISGVQALRLTGDKALRAHLERFVAELIATQDADGYLGPFPKDLRMTGPGLWDLWGQYHVMLGLFLYHGETGDEAAMAACRRCADLFCATFLDGDKRVIHAGSEEMNESSIHIFMLLYERTGEERYLRLAREIEKDWETPPSGDYVRTALAGIPFHQTPKPRWEGLHAVQAIAELHLVTGDEKYKRAFEQIYTSIRDGDRHNTGGFSSGEQATGNPYDPRPIETCCTIAWMTVAQDWLRISGDSRAADELELSTWNAVMGAQNPTGRWWTYNTPMDGERKASAHDIVFQARAGSPELNCCSVNGPRGLGILSEWAVMRMGEGVALNYYGPCEIEAPLAGGGGVEIEQKTSYPFDGHVEIRIDGPRRAVPVFLRIPAWSERTRVRVDGHELTGVKPGGYLRIERTWRKKRRIELDLDMTPQIWTGERESAGRFSVRRGPVLLAYDPRLDRYDPGKLPSLDPARVRAGLEMIPPLPGSLMSVRAPLADGGSVTLCDFATAGLGGNKYLTWLPMQGKPE